MPHVTTPCHTHTHTQTHTHTSTFDPSPALTLWLWSRQFESPNTATPPAPLRALPSTACSALGASFLAPLSLGSLAPPFEAKSLREAAWTAPPAGNFQIDVP
jgi:hypothetical protein